MHQLTSLIKADVQELLAQGDTAAIREAVGSLHPADTADLLGHLDGEERRRAFECLKTRRQIRVFEFLDEASQLDLLKRLGRDKMISIIEAMASDDRASFIKSLPSQTTESLLPLLAQAARNDIRRLVAHKARTAGAIMTTEYASLSPEVSVSQAFQTIWTTAPDRETVYYLYVTDAEHHLIGVLSLRELVLARPDQILRDIMNPHLISVGVDADQEEVARIIKRYNFLAVPVVDAAGVLVGIVTHDDILDILAEEQTEDVQKMGAIVPLHESYFQTPFLEIVRKRGIWLSGLFLGELLTVTALRHFQATIESIVTVAFFIPLIISSGGNTGSQSATLVVRGIALGEIGLRDWVRVFRREILVAMSLGLLLATIGWFRAWIFGNGVLMATAVATSLFVVVNLADMVGAFMPLLFRRLGFDPAVSSSPFLASLIDVVGIVIYFSIVHWILM